MPKRPNFPPTLPPPELPRGSGRIQRIVADKGFGFIRDATGVDYFFHRSSCPQFVDLTVGQAVTFQVEQTAKGPRAEAVVVVD
jgi:cold shock CspA family protein